MRPSEPEYMEIQDLTPSWHSALAGAVESCTQVNRRFLNLRWLALLCGIFEYYNGHDSEAELDLSRLYQTSREEDGLTKRIVGIRFAIRSAPS